MIHYYTVRPISLPQTAKLAVPKKRRMALGLLLFVPFSFVVVTNEVPTWVVEAFRSGFHMPTLVRLTTLQP